MSVKTYCDSCGDLLDLGKIYIRRKLASLVVELEVVGGKLGTPYNEDYCGPCMIKALNEGERVTR